jgi:2OG-Fe(II) oxygenase superfamily
MSTSTVGPLHQGSIYAGSEKETSAGRVYRRLILENARAYGTARPSKQRELVNTIISKSGTFYEALRVATAWQELTALAIKEKIQAALRRVNSKKPPAVIARKRHCIKHVKGRAQFTPWTEYKAHRRNKAPTTIPLQKGGLLKVHHCVVRLALLRQLLNDIKRPRVLRHYSIQTNVIPRLSCALHHDAAVDALESTHAGPAVVYSTSRQKARAFQTVPNAKEVVNLVNERMLPKLTAEEKEKNWTGCITVLFYRGGKDSIYWHSDNRQGEQHICCLIVKEPSLAAGDLKARRKVCVRTTRKPKQGIAAVGDEEIELFLQAGDVYEMDDVMQVHYQHCVPPITSEAGGVGVQSRAVMVFRRGSEVQRAHDAGKAVTSLNRPLPIPIKYFYPHESPLVIGKEYSVKELRDLNIHRNQQRGVGGNAEIGASTALISPNGPLKFMDKVIGDTVWYHCNVNQGAKTLQRNFTAKLPLAVLRKLAGETKFRMLGFYIILTVAAVEVECPPQVSHHKKALPVALMYQFMMEKYTV